MASIEIKIKSPRHVTVIPDEARERLAEIFHEKGDARIIGSPSVSVDPKSGATHLRCHLSNGEISEEQKKFIAETNDGPGFGY